MGITNWLTPLIPLVPLLLPSAITLVKSLRAPSRGASFKIKPAPRRVQYALNLLFLAAVVHLIRTLFDFAPENVFEATSSTFRTPNDVLFRRLASLRPLTSADDALKVKLANMDGRLLYAAYGPDALVNCPFCDAKQPRSYLLYVAGSGMMIPHVFHAGLLLIVTSSIISKEGARLRIWASVAAIALPMLDLAMMYLYGLEKVHEGERTGRSVFWYWQRLFYRDLAMAFVDSLSGFALWLAATNRMYKSPAVAERLDHTYRGFEMLQAKLVMLTDITNAVVRDKGLRAQYEAYWREQEAEMEETLQEKEVVDAVNTAVTMIDLPKLTEIAKVRADAALSAFKTHG